MKKDEEVTKNKVGKRRKLLWIMASFLAILSIPMIICIGNIMLVLNGCQDILPYRRNVDVTPLMDLEIPADLNLSKWAHADARMQSIGSDGVYFNVKRFTSVNVATNEFKTFCEGAHYKPNIVYGGQGDHQYCVSAIDPIRADPEGLCSHLGGYKSYVVLQKGNIVIEIYERSNDRNSHEKDAVIAQIATEIKQALAK